MDAGWYNDPEDPTRARWHDGQGWTGHRMVKSDWAGPGAPPPPGTPAPATPAWDPSPPAGSRLGAPPPPPQQQVVVQQVKKRGCLWWVGMAVVACVVIGVIAALAGGGDDDKGKPTVDLDADDDTGTTEAEGSYEPTPADFALTVVTIEKECFGSAGCNVTFDIDLSYIGPRSLDEDDSWVLIYDVAGGEDPQTGSLELDGDGTYRVDQSQFISTASSGAVLTATVTAVRDA